MAVVSYNESKNGNNSLVVHGNAEELKKVAEFVNSMYGKADNPDNDKDMVNHPSHYEHGIECIDEMILLYGVVETMSFCKLNAHKYRKRAFDKGGREDQDKSDWYMKEYAYLDSKSDFEIKDEIYKKYGLN
nr:MAG TPA: nucelotide kinase [Caudoviricetes sp.]